MIGRLIGRGIEAVPSVSHAKLVNMFRAYSKKLYGQHKAMFLTLWNAMPEIPPEVWQEAIVLGSVTPLNPYILQYEAVHNANILPALHQAFNAGGKLQAIDLARVLNLTEMFSLPHEAGAAWALAHGGKLITSLGLQQQETFRKLLAEAMYGKFTADELARATRGLWGFTDQMTSAFGTYSAKLEAKVKAGKMTTKQQADLQHKYANKLRARRAYVIARHQTVWALNAGQEAMWAEAVKRNLLDAKSTRRMWIVTPDELLCEFCAAMAGKMAKLGEPWIHPLSGKVLMTPQEGHPQCRCTEGLVFGGAALGQGDPNKPKVPKPAKVPKPKPPAPVVLPPAPKPTAPPPAPTPPAPSSVPPLAPSRPMQGTNRPIPITGPVREFTDRNAVERWTVENFSKWWDSLTGAEKEALHDYQGVGYREMNAFLRGKRSASSLTEQQHEYIRRIRAALQRGPAAPENLRAYRGVRDARAVLKGNDPETAAGLVIDDQAFTSISLIQEVSLHGFASDPNAILMEFILPKGVRCGSLKGGEAELVLPPGTKWRVKSISRRFNRWYALMEVVE